MKRDHDVMLAAARHGLTHLSTFADDVLREDSQFVTALVNIYGGSNALSFDTRDLKADRNRNIVLAAVS